MVPCCGDSRARPDQSVTFEYRGEGRLTIFGRVTGTRYSFPARGARVLVDRRDASALEIVEAMERVSSSEGAEDAEDAEKSTRGGTEARR
jgi:hypothetical protein